MSNREAGFTLIEILVALLMAGTAAFALALVNQSGIHQTSVTTANSAALSLATEKMEQFYAAQLPSVLPDLTIGVHGPVSVDERGEASIGGPYSISWDVVDAVPYAGARKVTVTVTHLNEETVRATLVAYIKG